ncbi:MAG: hypothetical protein ACI9MR_001547 [Myxococcota bacterium]
MSEAVPSPPPADAAASSASAPAQPSALDAAGLEAILVATEPGVLLVEDLIIRRVIRDARGLGRGISGVPHAHCYATDRATVLRLIHADEVLRPLTSLPDSVYLLPRPDSDALEGSRDALLLEYWRLLFHTRIDAILAARTRGPALARPKVLAMIDAIGQIPFDEVRTLLRDDNIVAEDDDEATELTEFFSLYLEFKHFQPEVLDHFFPSLRGRTDVDALAANLLDAPSLLVATRPADAPDPGGNPSADHDINTVAARPVGPLRARKLLARGRRVATRGDLSQAAVLFGRSAKTDHDEIATRARAARADALTRLGVCLVAAAGVDDPQGSHADAWRTALEPLVTVAAAGMKRVEARLMHDLARICDEHATEPQEINIGRWLRSFARKPMRRALPLQQLVNIARYFARAKRRLTRARIDPTQRAALKALLGDAVKRTHGALRAQVAPLLADALRASKLIPQGVPESVAFDKLVDELLDTLLDRGFITFGDLRDAIARNTLKMDDLRSPAELVVGDALLQLDKRLDAQLDGVYHRGEVYRRGLQRLSSIGFANGLGRFLVRYLILPFGCAFIALEGAQHLVALPVKLFGGVPPHIFSVTGGLILGGILFVLIHIPPIRRVAWRALLAAWDALKFVFVQLPARFMALSPIVWLTGTVGFDIARRYLFRPLWIAALVAGIVVMATSDSRMWLYVGVPTFAVVTLLLLSRFGIRAEERVQDGVIRGWHRFRYDVVPGSIAATIRFFKRVLELIEIVFYEVDQFLRFRQGDNPVMVALKVGFGFVWGILAYVARLYVNLLIEPQVNPIKHFPIVTVSHKLMIPLYLDPAVYELLSAPFSFLPAAVASTIAAATLWLLPGVFGFLAWEFKENWRLYTANRKTTLRPSTVGSHGETIYRLLRPGFHSGTVPKAFRKLRNAQRHRQPAEVRKHLEALHHVEESVETFVDRELRRLLMKSGRFPHADALHVDAIELTPYRIRIGLSCKPLGEVPLVITFDEQARYLVGGVSTRGWLDAVDRAAAAAFETALLGFYKYAGVDLVREQIVSILPGRPPYDIDTKGLLVWPGKGFETEVTYPLRTRLTMLRPRVQGPAPSRAFPRIPVGDIFFRKRPLPWERWVAAWAPTQTDPDPLRDLFGPLSVLNDDSLHNAQPDPAAQEPAA